LEITLELIIYLLTLGLVVGFTAGLLGIGGGGIMVPVLSVIFINEGVSAEKAIPLALGTSMASIVITSLSSMRAHRAKNNIIWKAFKSMAPGVILGVLVGTFIVSITNSLALCIFFTIFTAYVSVQLFLDKKPKPTRELLPKPYLFCAGGGIGTISALVSIGGGSLTVPFLIWQNIDGKKAIGTSAALGFPLSVTGALSYMIITGIGNVDTQTFTFGYVYLPAMLFISLTSFFTAKLGAKCTQILPVSILKKILGTLNMMLCIKMIVSVMSEF
jgi:uncharacterized membrane protein YfcA